MDQITLGDLPSCQMVFLVTERGGQLKSLPNTCDVTVITKLPDDIDVGARHMDGMTPPIYYYDRSIAPSGMAFVAHAAE